MVRIYRHHHAGGQVVFAAFADDAERAIMQSHADEMAVLPAVI
jgi:hypothetical protein